MQLYLLRHGDAQTEASIPDQYRALTPEGIASIERVARAIQRLDLQFDAVYSSPFLRARHTTELALGKRASKVNIQLTDHLIVGADFLNLFQLLNQHPADAHILLVGHEPYFSQLLSFLLVGTRDAMVDFRKASLCCIDAPHPVTPKGAVLKWLLPPQMMDSIR